MIRPCSGLAIAGDRSGFIRLLKKGRVKEADEVFVWIFHRISGILLIFLLSLQLVSGFFQASSSNAELARTMAGLHNHTVLNCLTVFLLILHALYGIRTILIDLGVKAEKLLFWICTGLGLVLFAVFVVLFLTLVAA